MSRSNETQERKTSGAESWKPGAWCGGTGCGQLTTAGLEALQQALLGDDDRLLQGRRRASALMCVQDWAVEGACVVGYCGWQGDGLQTVGEVEEYFARVLFEVDQALGEPAACRYFLNCSTRRAREECGANCWPR